MQGQGPALRLERLHVRHEDAGSACACGFGQIAEAGFAGHLAGEIRTGRAGKEEEDASAGAGEAGELRLPAPGKAGEAGFAASGLAARVRFVRVHGAYLAPCAWSLAKRHSRKACWNLSMSPSRMASVSVPSQPVRWSLTRRKGCRV